MKLVNYIRSEVNIGNLAPNVSNASVFQDERYLQPVLQDDPLLYSLHDIFEGDDEDVAYNVPIAAAEHQSADGDDSNGLELRRVQKELEAREMELDVLRQQTEAYKYELLSMRHMVDGVSLPHDTDAADFSEEQTKRKSDAVDSSYFASYNGHGELLSYVIWLQSDANVRRYTCHNVKRHSTYGRISRLHLREQASF